MFAQRGRLLCRVYVDGRVRRIVASKAVWIVATGELPHGVVKPRDGDEHDLRESNLIEVRRGPKPFDQAKGGKASSLDHRAKMTTTLINALAANPGSTVPQLSRLVGSSSSCTCVRLSKLADAGLCIGPRCDSRARWDLSERGRELAASTNPVVPDQRDRDILAALVPDADAAASVGPADRPLQFDGEAAVGLADQARVGETGYGAPAVRDHPHRHRSAWPRSPAAPGAVASGRTDQRRRRPRRANAVAAPQRRQIVLGKG